MHRAATASGLSTPEFDEELARLEASVEHAAHFLRSLATEALRQRFASSPNQRSASKQRSLALHH
jgi:hypothetical protein